MTKCKVVSIKDGKGVFEIDGERVEVDLARCAESFHKVSGGSGHSVGTRNITKCRFIFYSDPRVTITFYGPFAKLKFNRLQKKILAAGYRTFDVS